MFNMNSAMQFAKMMRNPQEMLQKMGIPQDKLDSPQNAMQYLLDSGRVNQNHIDQVKGLYEQLYNRK